MISGPTHPHPRLLLADLLRKKGGIDRLGGADRQFLESGLVFLEEDVEFGDGLRVDFLAKDAAGAPVLILAVENEDAADIPLMLLDLDHWFRENAFLLRQGLGLVESAPVGLRWDLEHRIFLVTQGWEASRLERLQGLAALPLQVFELAYLALRGRRQWYARLLPAWQAGEEGQLPRVPTGLVDLHQVVLVDHFLQRLHALSPAIEIHGDRYHRLVLFEGRPCAELFCSDREARLHIEERVDSEVLLSRDDVEVALDQVLRLLLERQAVAEGFPQLGTTGAEEETDPLAQPLPGALVGERTAELPSDRSHVDPIVEASGDPQTGSETSAHNGRVVPAGGRLRTTSAAKKKLPEARDLGPRLTDEEIDAFLKP